MRPNRTSLASRLRLPYATFGGTAAIVTSVGLIVGFGAVTESRATLVGALLIVAVADNLTDSLGIHIYQESENIDVRSAIQATVANFLVRLVTAASFVLLVVALPPTLVAGASVAWGLLLLGGLTFLLAHKRHVSPSREILIHVGIACAVVIVSRAIGVWTRACVR